MQPIDQPPAIAQGGWHARCQGISASGSGGGRGSLGIHDRRWGGYRTAPDVAAVATRATLFGVYQSPPNRSLPRYLQGRAYASVGKGLCVSGDQRANKRGSSARTRPTTALAGIPRRRRGSLGLLALVNLRYSCSSRLDPAIASATRLTGA